MSKIVNWQSNLLAKVEELADTPFEWGVNDCVIFAAKCIDAQTGGNVSENVIGKYNSEIGCKRYMLTQFKSADIRVAISNYLPERINPKLASRGDVVTFEGDTGLTAGVLWATGVWAMGPTGVVLFPINKITITDAWRV
ncbi:peptidoglycan hydrolase [Hafnia phage yong3]|nr:peptidoglycan hydrolase [Hafnia phage yong3]